MCVCVCRKELLVLGDILQAQRSISEWCLLSAILAIQSCNTTLSNWHGIIPLGILVSQTRWSTLRWVEGEQVEDGLWRYTMDQNHTGLRMALGDAHLINITLG